MRTAALRQVRHALAVQAALTNEWLDHSRVVAMGHFTRPNLQALWIAIIT